MLAFYDLLIGEFALLTIHATVITVKSAGQGEVDLTEYNNAWA